MRLKITRHWLPISFAIGLALASAIAYAAVPLRGAVQIFNGTKWLPLNPGTVDLPLVSNGAGADPAYEQIATGGIADNAVTSAKIAEPLNLDLGSATAPTYSFNGDANTGMWSAGADLLSFSTANAERMRVMSDGTVLFIGPVGTTTDNSSAVGILVNDGNRDPTATPYLGNIWVAPPVATSGLTQRQTVGLILDSNYWDGTASQEGRIGIHNVRTAASQTGYRLGLFSSDQGGNFERLSVLANGNIGIGNAVPATSLEFADDVNHTIQIRTRTTNAAGNALTINAATAGAGATGVVGGALNLNGGAAAGTTGAAGGGDILLNGGTAVNAGSDGDVILANLRGRVGIGTATPISAVHVTGPSVSGSVAYLQQTGTKINFDTALNIDQTGAFTGSLQPWTASGNVTDTYLARIQNANATTGEAVLDIDARGADAIVRLGDSNNTWAVASCGGESDNFEILDGTRCNSTARMTISRATGNMTVYNGFDCTVAGGCITSSEIVDSTVTTLDVAVDTLTDADLAANACGASEVAGSTNNLSWSINADASTADEDPYVVMRGGDGVETLRTVLITDSSADACFIVLNAGAGDGQADRTTTFTIGPPASVTVSTVQASAVLKFRAHDANDATSLLSDAQIQLFGDSSAAANNPMRFRGAGTTDPLPGPFDVRLHNNVASAFVVDDGVSGSMISADTTNGSEKLTLGYGTTTFNWAGGAWQVGGSSGTSGQVWTSQAASAPQWKSPVGTFFITMSTGVVNDDCFLGPGWTFACDGTTEDQADRVRAPAACTARNLYVEGGNGTDGTQAYTFRLRINAVNSGISCNTSGTGLQNCTDLVNTAAVAAGDKLSLQFDRTSVAGSLPAGQTITFQCN